MFLSLKDTYTWLKQINENGGSVLSAVKFKGIQGLNSILDSFVGKATIATTATYTLYKAIQYFSDKYNLSYASAIKNTEESFSNFSSTKTEVEDLKSQVDTAKDSLTSMADTYNIEITGTESITELIDKLKSSDLSLEDRAQVSQIEQENASIERQIALKEKLLEYQQKEAASNAMDTMGRGEQSVAQQVAQKVPGGKKTYQGTVSNVNVVDAVKENVSAIQEYENKIADLEKKQASFDPGSKQWKQAQEDIDSYNEAIQTLTTDLDSKEGDLTTLLQSFSVNGEGLVALKGYEEQFNSVKEALNSINNIDLTPAQQQLASIESFFDGSTGKNFIKDSLLDAAKNGKNLEYVLNGLGYELSDIGENVDIETLSKYFDDLANSANEAANAVKEVNNNLTMDDIASSFESKNAGDDYVALNDYLKKAKELYDQGLTGTDDFKSVAEAISYNIDSSAESFKQNYDKLQRYFIEDGDGNLTGQGVQNFLTDLQSLGKGYATWNAEAGKWDINMSNTAQAAKELGISVQTMEALLGRIKDYDNLGEFDFTSAIDEFETAKSSLESLRSLYDEMESSDRKDALGLKLDEWESQLGTWENDLATLDSDVVLNIKLEYDLATIQSQIDEVKGLIEGGDNSVENNAQVIAGNQKYINIAEEGLGLNVEGVTIPVEYQANEDTIEALKAQLKNATSEEDKVKIQAEIENLQELQKDLLNAFSDAHPEINADSSIEEINNAWNDFVSSNDGKEIIAKMIADDEEAKEKIAELLDIEPEDIVVPVSADTSNAEKSLNHVEAYEFSEKVAELTANDDATPYLKLWNELSMNPKFGIMKAEDQATYVVALWNALTPEQKEAYLKGEITVTDNATGTVQTVDGALNALPLNPNADITATDSTSGAVTSAKLSLNSLDGKTVHTYIVTHKSTKGDDSLAGTAHVGGTSHVSGTINDDSWIDPKWRTKKDEVALVGEEAPELVATRQGQWYTVGDKGAEFTHIPKGSVVFDGKQTEELLTKGYINGRGKAHLGGTAYLGSSNGSFNFSGGASKYNGKSKKSTKTSNKKTSSKSVKEATQANTNATKENTEAQKETIDWIETLVDTQKSENERLSNAIENFEMHFNQNSAIDAYIKDSQAYMKTLRNAQNAYMSKANALGLDGAYVHKIWSGELSIEDITDEDLADKIKKYQDWYNQAKDLGDQLTEINTKIRESKINKLDNIKDDYDNLVDYAKSIADYNEAINDLYEARNLVGLEDPMMQVVNQQNAIRQAFLNEEKELNDQLNSLVADGTIAEYSDTWLKWKKEINGVSQEILECDKTLEELKETIREIRFNDFEKSLDALEFTSDMASSIRELMSEEGIYDDDAKITESGIAQLGLMGTELVSAKQKVANYNTAIEALAKDLENGNITQAQYNEQLQEYQKNQMDAIKSAKSAKDAILDLVKNGIEKETEAMDKLISKRKEDLSKQKEYYDFQKTMTDKSKEINKVRAQLASLEGDNSLEALSKRRKLESQLLELQDEYNENLRDREYDVVSDAYDKTLEDFKDNQDETLKELETNLDAQNKAIADALEIAKENYSGVYNQLQILADEYGFALTDTIVKPWEDAISAIDQYQQSVGKLQGNISIDTSKIQGESPSGEQTIPTNNESSNQNLSKSANGTWIKQNGRWWYQHDDGSYTTNGWENIDGKWYKFDNNGWMQTGWQTDGKDENGNTKWYYLDSNGAMQSGWQKVNGKWYYLDSSGLMQTGWKNVNGMWYLLDQSGAMQTGWQKVDGKWYYLNSNGSMAVSQWIDDKYYVDHTGVMATNGYIKSKSGNQYYWVNDKGVYEPRWTTDHPDLEKYQLFYSSGAYRTKRGYGYVDDKDKKLYPGSELVLESNGIMTDYGILRPLTGRETIFNEEQRKALWEMSLGKMPVGYEQTSPLDNMKVNFSKNDNQEVNIHYDNLIGNIEYVDKNALPDLQTILKKSFDYNVKELKKYSKR